MKKTRYYWVDTFQHCVAATETGPSFRHRFVDSNGKTVDGINERKDLTILNLPFWEAERVDYRISRASFRQYLKTGNVPLPVKRKA